MCVSTSLVTRIDESYAVIIFSTVIDNTVCTHQIHLRVRTLLLQSLRHVVLPLRVLVLLLLLLLACGQVLARVQELGRVWARMLVRGEAHRSCHPHLQEVEPPW